MVKLAPSILSADFGNLLEDIKKVEAAGADMLHIDIMDGMFVPNISFGPTVIKGFYNKVNIPFDVHLMIVDPDRYLEDFAGVGAKWITVHAETCVHLHRTVQQIKLLGAKAAVSLNPGSPLNLIEEVLPELDMVLLMTVNPGFGGQSFIENSIDKIKRLKKMIDQRGLSVDIQVDGGINLKNCRRVAEAGANILVAGSAVFDTSDINETVKLFREELKGL